MTVLIVVADELGNRLKILGQSCQSNVRIINTRTPRSEVFVVWPEMLFKSTWLQLAGSLVCRGTSLTLYADDLFVFTSDLSSPTDRFSTFCYSRDTIKHAVCMDVFCACGKYETSTNCTLKEIGSTGFTRGRLNVKPHPPALENGLIKC